MFTLANQPQGIGRNLDNGFRLLAAGLGPIALLLLIMIVIDVILFTLFGAGMFTVIAQLQSGQMPAGGLAGFALFFLLFYIVNITFNNAMTAKYGSLAYGTDMTLGQAISTGLKKILPVFAYAILYALIIVAASIPLMILIAVLPPQDVIGFIALVIGMIPPMIVALTLIMGTYLIIIDDVGVFEAISRSHKLVWGNWWRTSLYFAVIMIILFAVIIAIQLVFGLLIAVLAGSAGENMTFMITLQVVNQLVSMIFMPVMIALMIPYYHDLKLRKEGGDLAAKIIAA